MRLMVKKMEKSFRVLEKNTIVRVLRGWNISPSASPITLKKQLDDNLPLHNISHHQYSRDEIELFASTLNLNTKTNIKTLTEDINNKLKEIKIERSSQITLLLIDTLKKYVKVCISEHTNSNQNTKRVIEGVLTQMSCYENNIDWETIEIARETIPLNHQEFFNLGLSLFSKLS